MTQIAVEAVREPLAVTYGHQTWVLWSRGFHWSLSKGPLTSMQGVARDAIDRLPAEFHKGDLYAAYRLFDLEAWAVLRHLPESGAQAAALWSTMKSAGECLCGALGVVFDDRAWARAAIEALTLRGRMLRRSAGKHVDNRVVWRAVISSRTG